MAVLILAKHDNAQLNDATAKTVTAAKDKQAVRDNQTKGLPTSRRVGDLVDADLDVPLPAPHGGLSARLSAARREPTLDRGRDARVRGQVALSHVLPRDSDYRRVGLLGSSKGIFDDRLHELQRQALRGLPIAAPAADSVGSNSTPAIIEWLLAA